MNKVIIDFQRCKECGYCSNFCPRAVLEPGKKVNKSGYYPPVYAHPDKCIACGICARVCPDAAIEVIKDYEE